LICEKGKKDVDKKDKSKRDKHRLGLWLQEDNNVDNRVRKLIHRLSIKHAQENVRKMSARRPCEFAACEQMKMNMKNGLAGIMAVIDDHPVTAFIKPSFGSDFFGNKKQVTDDFAVYYGDTVNIRNVFFRDNERMDRCLGIDVLKGDRMLVLMDDLCGDLFFNDVAKQAV
jgi:hypothetical protein